MQFIELTNRQEPKQGKNKRGNKKENHIALPISIGVVSATNGTKHNKYTEIEKWS